MNRSALAAGIVAVLVIAAAAYYYIGVQSQPRVRDFNLVGGDFFFMDSGGKLNPDLEVRVGDTVRIILTNRGGVVHELVIVTPHEYEEMLERWSKGEMMGEDMHHELAFSDAEIEDVKPGEVKSTTFTADKVGEYMYVCFEEKPDLHAKLGMFGKFTVVS